MTASRAWIIRNLGFDPIATPAPISTFANAHAALPRGGQPEDLQREIIDFDSEGPEGAAFFAFSTATGLSRFTDIPWPKSLAPKDGREGPQGQGGRVADGRRAGRDLDRGRGARAEPRADAGQGFAQRLRLLQAQLRSHREEDAQGLSGAPGRTAGRVLDDEDRRERRSSSSSPTRTCRRTRRRPRKRARPCRTRMCGGRSLRK